MIFHQGTRTPPTPRSSETVRVRHRGPTAPVCSANHPRSRGQQGCLCQSQWSSPAQFTNPSYDSLFAATNARASDAAIFFKWTLGSHRPDANSAAVFLEEQLVARANTHSAP